MGAEMLLAWGRNRLKVPGVVVSSGALPAWANKDTLVVAVSYSGATAEAISLTKDALRRGCKVFVIARGEALAKIAKSRKLPAYIFNDSITNPSGQPRMGVGITLGALLGALSKLGLLVLTKKEITEAMGPISHIGPIAQIARQLKNRLPILIAAEHLTGNLVAFRNQVHENAKQFAILDTLPELNHHLLEGLARPKAVQEMVAVFLRSRRYSASTKKRFDVTKDIVRRQKIKTTNINVNGISTLAEVLMCLQLGSRITLALADLNHVDPAKIPWVDYLKKRMASG